MAHSFSKRSHIFVPLSHLPLSRQVHLTCPKLESLFSQGLDIWDSQITIQFGILKKTPWIFWSLADSSQGMMPNVMRFHSESSFVGKCKNHISCNLRLLFIWLCIVYIISIDLGDTHCLVYNSSCLRGALPWRQVHILPDGSSGSLLLHPWLQQTLLWVLW